MEAYPQIAGFNETINGNKSFDETAFETVPEAKTISQQAAVEDAELEEEMNLLDFDPMSMISNLGKYATLLEKKKTVIETSDHDCGNTHFFLGNGKFSKIHRLLRDLINCRAIAYCVRYSVLGSSRNETLA